MEGLGGTLCRFPRRPFLGEHSTSYSCCYVEGNELAECSQRASRCGTAFNEDQLLQQSMVLDFALIALRPEAEPKRQRSKPLVVFGGRF